MTIGDWDYFLRYSVSTIIPAVFYNIYTFCICKQMISFLLGPFPPKNFSGQLYWYFVCERIFPIVNITSVQVLRIWKTGLTYIKLGVGQRHTSLIPVKTGMGSDAARVLTHHILDKETPPPGIWQRIELGLFPFSMINHQGSLQTPFCQITGHTKLVFARGCNTEEMASL